MSHIQPRLSNHPAGPFDEVEANQTLMTALGHLSAQLRMMPIVEADIEGVKNLLREAKREIEGLATGDPDERQKKIDAALQLLTRTLDHTFLHHLKPKEQTLFCKWLLEVLNEHDFSADVYAHIKKLSLRTASKA